MAIWAPILALAAPVALHAQLEPETQTGSRIPVAPRTVDPLRTGQMMKDFSRCMYDRYQAKAVALLQNSDPVTIDYTAARIDRTKIQHEFGMEECIGEGMNLTQVRAALRFNDVRLRSLLAEEAYLAAHKEAPHLDPTAIEGIERKYFSSEVDKPQARALAMFADCIVFRDAAKADAVLRTMPGSKDERIAARALAPTLGACLTEGQTLELTAATIRMFVADGLWARFVRTSGPLVVGSR